MPESDAYPPLQFLHPVSSFIPLKLKQMRELPTETLLSSLAPGEPHCLKTRKDGTIIDGHHRILILRERGVDVDQLPREIVTKEDF